MDISSEIRYQTTRSGGKGGQNVNKVETAVLAYFPVEASVILNDEQKKIILEKLSNRINSEGELWLKAQNYRTQLENKKDATDKLNQLIEAALKKKKPRIAVKMPKAIKEARLKSKKINSEIKTGRKKFRPSDF